MNGEHVEELVFVDQDDLSEVLEQARQNRVECQQVEERHLEPISTATLIIGGSVDRRSHLNGHAGLKAPSSAED